MCVSGNNHGKSGNKLLPACATGFFAEKVIASKVETDIQAQAIAADRAFVGAVADEGQPRSEVEVIRLVIACFGHETEGVVKIDFVLGYAEGIGVQGGVDVVGDAYAGAPPFETPELDGVDDGAGPSDVAGGGGCFNRFPADG